MARKNLFIEFEGIDGSGKSTQVQMLRSYLESLGEKVYVTCEPTDNPIGRMIRDIFNHRMEADQRVIAALFVADRLQHVLHSSEGMLQKQKEGYTVITDRYYFSSYAYHSVHGIDMEWVIRANALSAELLKPDLHIYLDIAPEESMDRIQKGRDQIEMYENLENQKKVHAQYEAAFALLQGRENILRVNAHQSPEQVNKAILEGIKPLLF
jgi:dTMP kinase